MSPQMQQAEKRIMTSPDFFFGAQYSTYATKKERGRVSELRLVLSEGQAEADRPHGHAGYPQPYLQHREHQEAPNNLAAGAHPSSVIIPSRSERETNHPPSSFHYPPYPFRPLPDPKTFLSSPAKHYPQEIDFQNRRPSSRTGPEQKSRSTPWHVQAGIVEFSWVWWSESRRRECTGRRAFKRQPETWRSQEQGAPLARRCPEFCRFPSLRRKPAPF